MTSRKRNDFLEGAESEDEDHSQGYDSEAEEFRKGDRVPKRRKIENDASENSVLEEDDAEEHANYVEKAPQTVPKAAENNNSESKVNLRKDLELPGVSKPLTKKNLVATAAAVKRSGVVYLSRIPPFMKPSKLRSLLEPYGAINRIFLTPEDPASHTRRVRHGGNKKTSYTDGWVEWVNKVDAKRVCELLNTRIIGGKKGTYYYDDVWNLLYLKGFKWHNLTAQIAAENAEKASRMRAEISKTAKENKSFVQNVERAKMLDGMASKRAAKQRKEGDGTGGLPADLFEKTKKDEKRGREFKQNTVIPKTKVDDQPEQVKRVLSKIF